MLAEQLLDELQNGGLTRSRSSGEHDAPDAVSVGASAYGAIFSERANGSIAGMEGDKMTSVGELTSEDRMR